MLNCSTRPSRRAWRLLLACGTLYALLLQALLGGMAAQAAPASFEVLCLQAAGDGEAPTGKEHGGQAALGCCLAATPTAPVLPSADCSTIDWPARAPIRAAWRGPAIPTRFPPERIASPRAPPRD